MDRECWIEMPVDHVLVLERMLSTTRQMGYERRTMAPEFVAL